MFVSAASVSSKIVNTVAVLHCFFIDIMDVRAPWKTVVEWTKDKIK